MDARETGIIISKYRNHKGMTQKDLSYVLGVTDRAVSNWERGINYPDITLLEKLSETLGCSVHELLSVQTSSEKELIHAMVELSNQGKKMIEMEIRIRSVVGIALAAFILIAAACAFRISEFSEYGMIRLGLLGGIIVAAGCLVGNMIMLALKNRKIQKEDVNNEES